MQDVERKCSTCADNDLNQYDEPCRSCRAYSNWTQQPTMIDCPDCAGTGEVEILYSDRPGAARFDVRRAGDVHHTETCQRCGGAKQIEVDA